MKTTYIVNFNWHAQLKIIKIFIEDIKDKTGIKNIWIEIKQTPTWRTNKYLGDDMIKKGEMKIFHRWFTNHQTPRRTVPWGKEQGRVSGDMANEQFPPPTKAYTACKEYTCEIQLACPYDATIVFPK